MNSAPSFKIYPLGEAAITIEFGDRIDAVVNQCVLSVFYCLQEKNIPGITDLIPAYSSLTVVYDIIRIRKDHAVVSARQFIQQQVEAIIKTCAHQLTTSARSIEVPVCYDLSFGIDLEEMSNEKQLTINEIIQLHCTNIYRVYMIGFLPGFAYMGITDEKIATARRQNPRTNIAAGSVGIAGSQTGIYPLDSPGGWNIIGRTPLKIFDAEKESPVFLQAGDTIKFVPITIEEFNKIKQDQ